MTYLTTPEAAAYLTRRGLTDSKGGPVRQQTVTQWCLRGRLPGAVKVGSERRGEWRIPIEVLDAFTPFPSGRPRKERSMKAIEIKLDSGTYYISLRTWDHNKVLVPMDNGQRVLSPQDVRANWDAWVSDLVSDDELLTAEELASQYPNIAIDYED